MPWSGSSTFWRDRKSTRLNSSHLVISYAVFCLKKKTFRARIHQALRSRVELHPPLQQAIYHAHATDASVGNVYNWLGRAFSAHLWLRLILIRWRGAAAAGRVVTALRRLLDALCAGRVDFVIVGGFAGTLHGSAIPPRDLDVVYARDAANFFFF